ncbi:glycerol-3-phosphate dehydrogenase [Daejeonella rubra]|uniref:Glycerol-3-phosphate dehydrogenase n=2 Tax=Daejeonella rubra TaxID=990371 RepID=A0A1G9LQD7_9SPHI|nr:glycerol-3-phosphate dehydrogenase [Daejeonella rubra]
MITYNCVLFRIITFMQYCKQDRSVLESESEWDFIIIGGGATGLGTALDSASRGFKTLLLEQSDFAKGTSSRSTKLVHGGVRYLAQGDISLVYQALKERGRLQVNAAHLVSKEEFIIPCYDWFSVAKYLTGLKMYDWLAGRYSFGRSRFLSRKEVQKKLPGLADESLVGAISYYDGKFDDARLAVNIAQTCIEKGGSVLNYVKVTGLLKNEQGKVTGVKAMDILNNTTYLLRAKAIINATGVFVDDILLMNTPDAEKLVRPSQGVHLVIDSSFLDSDSALMIPKTSDNRVLFAVPWHSKLLVGTTDTPIETHSLEPRALKEEVDFILDTASKYFKKKVDKRDVLSVFAGLRPLAAPEKNDTNTTREISRDHKLMVSKSGLITITGGKWTTYRKMSEETVDTAIQTSNLENKTCVTKDLKIHSSTTLHSSSHLSIYGTDMPLIEKLALKIPAGGDKLHPSYPNIKAEVIWAVRNEMAYTVEDVLARRMRMLFIDAKAAIEMCRTVAELMAQEMHRSQLWVEEQILEFTQTASEYLLEPLEKEQETILI